MTSLGKQFTACSACLVLYLMAVLVLYRPTPLNVSKHGSTEGERVRFQEDLLLSVARDEGVATGRRGGAIAIANEEESSSKGLHCQDMFTLNTGGDLWVDDEKYTDISRQLPSILTNWNKIGNITSASMATSTRLQMLNGSVPYLPCEIRQFDPNDFGSCVSSRSGQGYRTWIAFVGDSNGRLKIHSMLYFLPAGFDYTFYLGYQKVPYITFLSAVAHHRHRPMTFDIIGHRRRQDGLPRGESPFDPPLPFPSPNTDVFSLFNETENPKIFNFTVFPLRESEVPPDYDLRVTLAWAPLGSEANAANFRHRIKVTKVKEWAQADIIPDVIVVGFGTWMMLTRMEMGELTSFAESVGLTRPLVEPLTRLAKRTTVLWWHQSRYFWFNQEYKIDLGHNDAKKMWEERLHMTTFSDAIPFMDAWIWKTSFNNTGMWQWDSTLPFNLASLRDCQKLKEAGISDNVYKGRWLNCKDVHHSSYETNFVEIQMILNLLCNPFDNSNNSYCCSTD